MSTPVPPSSSPVPPMGTPVPPMSNVFVIAGAAGSGKTTFGLALAKRLGIGLLDLDDVTAPLVDEFRTAHPELDEAGALAAVRDDRYVELQRAAVLAATTGGSVIVTAPFTAEISSSDRWGTWVAPFAGVADVHLIWLVVTPQERLRRMTVRGASRDEHLIAGGTGASPLPASSPPVVEHLRLNARRGTRAMVRQTLSHFGNASASV